MKKKPMKKVMKKSNYKKIGKVKKHTTYLNKIMKSQLCNVYYGVRESNHLHDNQGGLAIKRDLVTGNEYPLHIYPLESIINDGNQPTAGYKLNSNGYDFSVIGPNVEGFGITGQNHTTMGGVNSLGKNLLYKNYTDIRVLLWGQDTKKCVYQMYLIKLVDEDLDPTISPTTTDVNTQEKRQLLFTKKLLKKMVTNPVVSEIHTKQLRKEYQILWSKTYSLREKLTTEDQNQHKLVKVFRKEDRNISYTNNPSVTVNMTADHVSYPDPNSVPSMIPSKQSQKTFLVIVANTTNEDEANTYDIQIKSKYTLLGNL